LQNFSLMLNNILVDTYHNILRLESDFLRSDSRLNLSIREMHLLECVGSDKENGKTVSEIAEFMKVARPTATVAINKLESKGYLHKQVSALDGRMVHVKLTKDGHKVDEYHKAYHRSMVQAIEQEFTEEEKEYLIRTILRLDNFFKRNIPQT